MDALLPALERTVDLVDAAKNKISLPEDRFRNALFWFIQTSPSDAQALAHLQEGETTKALSLLDSETSFSSLINRGVLALILGDLDTAISTIFKLIRDEEQRTSFAHATCGPLFEICERDAEEMFIDELSKSVPLPELFLSVDRLSLIGVDSVYIRERITEGAEKELEKILSTFDEQKDKSLEATQKLIDDCAPYLGAMRAALGDDNVQYRHLSTTVEKKALGMVVENVNLTMENESIESSLGTLHSSLNDAWRIMLCLSKLSLELTAKRWLDSQTQTMKILLFSRYIEPDKSVDFALTPEWEIFHTCSTKMDYTDYLQLFPHGYYVDEAGKALEIFERQEKEEKECFVNQIAASRSVDELLPLVDECERLGLMGTLDDKMFSLCSNKHDYRKYLEIFEDNARHKEEASKHLKIEVFAKKVKNYIVDHKGIFILIAILILIAVLVFIAGGLSSMFKVLMWVFLVIAYFGFRAITHGEHMTGLVVFVLAALFASFCYWGKETVGTSEKVKDEYELLKKDPTEDNCKSFLQSHPDSPHWNEVMDLYYEAAEQNGVKNLNELAKNYASYPQGKKAETRVERICDSLYRIAEEEGSLSSWQDYRGAVPEAMYRDSQNKIDSILMKGWDTDENAWKTASAEKTYAAYQKYLYFYPNGKHKKQAERLLKNYQIDDIFKNSHKALPPPEKVSSSNGQTSTLTIINSSNKPLTFIYSGPSSQQVSIAPNQRKSYVLSNGKYRMAATAANLEYYTCTVELTGGEYIADYIIR